MSFRNYFFLNGPGPQTRPASPVIRDRTPLSPTGRVVPSPAPIRAAPRLCPPCALATQHGPRRDQSSPGQVRSAMSRQSACLLKQLHHSSLGPHLPLPRVLVGHCRRCTSSPTFPRYRQSLLPNGLVSKAAAQGSPNHPLP
jgi:hypothetical protein